MDPSGAPSSVASNQSVAIAGASGDLGARIARELLRKGARVRALTRGGDAARRLEPLRGLGAEVVAVDFADVT
ncbi:MAG: NmrA-like family, partial [Planctomycetota bacterium]